MAQSRRTLVPVIALMALTGCMTDTGDGIVSRLQGAVPPAVLSTSAKPAPQDAVLSPAEAAPIIHALQMRPSVIQPGTPYARVAGAVIASDARVAEAELRVARLRAQAAKRNWMPRIGPNVSLTSLGDFVASLVIQQVIFDNGRKVAERDLARANVEEAAVRLVEDSNRRVFDALSLYVMAEENRALAAHLTRADEDMAHFEWVLNERVKGGVSNASELNVVRQKRAANRARASEATEAARTAIAELNAMSASPLSDLRGLGTLKDADAGEALGVLRARAEREQLIAQARIARASHLPGLAANGAVTRTGGTSAGLEVTTDGLFGLGTGAELQAIEASKATADRKVTEARETAARRIASQQSRLAAYRRQAEEAAGLTASAKTNLDMFRAQFEAGQRQVMDVVGTYETYARALETEIELKYKAARAALELARLRGALAEGGHDLSQVLDMASRAGQAMVRSVPSAAPANALRKPRFSEKAQSRAQLIRVLAGRLGHEAKTSDIVEALAQNAGCDDSYDAYALRMGVEAAGLLALTDQPSTLTPGLWPAIAVMINGQAVLVLGQDGDTLTVYDETTAERRSGVPAGEFLSYFSGALIRAEAPVALLAETHATATREAHWFWGQFSRFSKQFGEVAIGSFVANLLAVAVALFSLQVYDRVIPHQSEATLWVLAAGAGLALLLEAFLKIARSRLLDGAGRQIEMGVQGLLMHRLLSMRSDTPGRQPSQLFSAMREFGSVREFFTASTAGALADIPFVFIFLLLVWSIAGSVVWVLIAGGLLMVIPGVFLQKRMIRLTQEMQGASARQSRLLQETVTELDTIKTQRAEDRFTRLWEELTAVQALKSSEQRTLAATLTFWSQGIQQATYVGAVIMGTYLVFAGNFTVGSIIAVGILSSRTLAPLTQLSGILARWGNVKAALDGLDAIADVPQDRDATRTYLRRERIEGHFALQGVSFRYDEEGGQAALDLQGLTIPAGQVLAVLGANGSGKSTFLKLLTGLYAPQSGKVMIDGMEMAQIDARDLRRSIGYLGQDVRLFQGTLRDNLNLSLLERDDERLYAALDFAGLGQYVKAHPKGLDLDIRDGGEGLSVGQRQSIGWARLWLQDPSVCLLDEPTASLDQTLEKTLISRLEHWLSGRTAVIATHRVPILGLADRTMILSQGRMAVDGPRDEVLAHLRGSQGAA